ncbi:MAG: hypothetical protein ACD_38C00030G0012 [uncultured bacterium]|uniref:Uncharacterized protein n=1 Tax=Candidatus Daviesbacteria bacterium GW2011_GWC2_40_12 TaxID=1618431 RepID=A0A0G0QWN2_9BACT|nr:MAG: hypothetical protein ACD_38C00030G0012 [uncultured bacterium]KKQ84856.1 MAG: hypothetical protein UT04_C0011G0030 [Candidatus Daviesbacteria bacterium GW2011_GWF2_38_7]KKR16511.1 MAG: hypothetical protein UT45_C0005G0040 [Candidatus Daviesbacteria bacterium GW2011_GWA2_39_33]KKR41776.1 MAG: hypothetical protein UT77_C0006G0008 [Candidatus Daviesbacteria bacterium GW2011_GWC2_40_12]OGE21143.1 MAG: hypothetical protein A2778_02870 [Candidatus Daviesbacteria bacterium RIFCSPHIGHO2_01_FULL_
MNIGDIKVNKTQLILIIILLIGLIAGVYLVQTRQIFKSKAASEINTALEVTDDSGNALEYQGNGTYKTKSLNVRVGIKDLEQLK